MERIEFSLSGGLSPAQVQMIHDAVLTVLEETGLACEHPPTVEAATSTPGVRFENGRLKFAPEVVEDRIARARAAGKKHQPEQRLRVTGPWTCFNIIDVDTDQVRPSTASDAAAMLKLAASFNEDGPPPVYPCDLDERLQVLWLEKACLELTPGLGGAMVSHEPETIRWIGKLHAAAGRRYTLALQFVISPLRLDHLALDLFWRFKDDPLINVSPSICPIPTGGMTAPLFASGLLAQSIAESIGGMIVAERLKLIGPDALLPVRVDYGDMRYLTVGYSLPENVMIQVLLRDLAEHFAGYRLQWIYLDTNAKRADAFAAADRMAYLLMLGLAGFRHFFMGAGQMSMDEIFSPAQFIIDMEMGRYVQHILDGMPWHGDPAEVARTVAEGVAEENFIAHDTTLTALRHLFESQLFQRSNVGQWRGAGEPTIEQLALGRARAAIESYHFELDPGRQAELDRTFQEACQSLGVDLASQPLPAR
ncbi:MAG: trimethylamine methyltransferase family protein [Armatimonadota bacterium]|nr:trimethylamine methyltransferase family protein [Armatimonadota bacterium]